MANRWRCRDRLLSLDRTLVMGICNVTPDSFYDGGRYVDVDAAIAHGLRLVEAGADIVDVGGESTRPGAAEVPVSEELRRVLPVVERLAADEVCVSIDTRHPRVAVEALHAGAAVVNDVAAGRLEDADAAEPTTIRAAARVGAGVVLMHMRGTPGSMQQNPEYDDVVVEVRDFLAGRARAARLDGCNQDSIVLDPGIGFGKTPEHNLALIANVDQLAALGYPVLIGTSRKSMFGKLLGLPLQERLTPSLVTAAWAVLLGASIVRTHDVAATVAAVRYALRGAMVTTNDRTQT